jgi:flavin reductase (DIM6/NTAB) family NADH-FMN oxidoreductase RutF
VTVVTSIGPEGPSGATANAVTSLSLDPPMMLACLDRGSRTLTSVRAQGRFGVNALAAGEAELARSFSAKDPAPEKWTGVEWTESEHLPRLEGALVWVACELRDLIDGGDHLILTGNVIQADSREGEPLLFHRGGYRDLLAES